jgi:hypothetical protein
VPLNSSGHHGASPEMTSDLEQLMSSLSDPERDRLRGAFASDPELAEGVRTMLADLPAETQARLLQRLAVHLGDKPLGGGALLPALTDVIYDALERSDRENE